MYTTILYNRKKEGIFVNTIKGVCYISSCMTCFCHWWNDITIKIELLNHGDVNCNEGMLYIEKRRRKRKAGKKKVSYKTGVKCGKKNEIK